jgi:hypothetical protein
VVVGISPTAAALWPAVDGWPNADGFAAAATVPASAGVPSQPLVAAAKPRRVAARNSVGIQCENIASAGTTSMQLTSNRERNFMVSGLGGSGLGGILPDDFGLTISVQGTGGAFLFGR